MGIMDKVKGMLKQHGDKADQGVDKAGQAMDSKTGGKHSDKIDTGSDKAKDAMDRYSDGQGGGGGQGGGPGGGGRG